MGWGYIFLTKLSLLAAKGKAVEMEDIKFHQCVRLARFENDRTISFIPPDGEFELMSYRLNTQVKPLIWCEAVVESHSGSRIEYMIKAKAQFKRRSTANNVEIIVPVPEDADSPKFKVRNFFVIGWRWLRDKKNNPFLRKQLSAWSCITVDLPPPPLSLALLDNSRNCYICSRAECCYLENQTVPGRKGVFDEGTFWFTICPKW